MFSIHLPWNGLDWNGGGTCTILFRVASGSHVLFQKVVHLTWQTEAALPFLPLHISIPPRAAASILLWHREQDKFVGAAAVVKWRPQNGLKWARGAQTKGEQLSVSTTEMWTDHYETPIHISAVNYLYATAYKRRAS